MKMLFVSQTEPADTGLASLILLQSYVVMTPATDDILHELATEARRLKQISNKQKMLLLWQIAADLPVLQWL